MRVECRPRVSETGLDSGTSGYLMRFILDGGRIVCRTVIICVAILISGKWKSSFRDFINMELRPALIN